MQNHEQKRKVKKTEKLPFSPWAASTTWLHVGAPQKIHEK
jgi:hypothetical protein